MGRFKTYIRSENKYHNHIITIDNIKFASKGEAQRYIELRAMKKCGEITGFERQPTFELQPRFTKGGVKYREIRYIADFRVTYPDGHQDIEDVKGKGGYTTPEFELKKKMFEYKFPDLHLEIVQRSGKGMERFDGSCDGDNVNNGDVIITETV
jgi:hypothetical protein